MYESTLPSLVGQKFNDIAEAVITINAKLESAYGGDWIWYSNLPIKQRAHACLEWVVVSE